MKVGSKLTFKKDNNIPYEQEFDFFVDIPSDIQFTVKSKLNNGKVKLVASGYGIHVKGKYGHGAIYVTEDNLI